MGSQSAGEQVTRQELPPEIVPFLTGGLEEIFGRFRQGPTPVPGLQPQTEQAIASLSAADPLLGTAQDILQRTAAGEFLDVTQDPTLNMVFEAAADPVIQSIQSRFAGAGRNVGAGAPVAARDLGTLSAGIFGPAAQAALNRQQQAARLLPALSGLDEARLLQAGGILEQREREELAAPDVLLGNLVGQLGTLLPFSGSAVTQPLTTNPFASGLGGALGGAALGSAVGAAGGPFGVPAGALIGGLGGLLSGFI